MVRLNVDGKVVDVDVPGRHAALVDVARRGWPHAFLPKCGVDATRAPRAPVSVDWTVMGTHPLAGHYRSKTAFFAGTFAKLDEVLPKGAQLSVEHLIVKDDQAVIELHLGPYRQEPDAVRQPLLLGRSIESLLSGLHRPRHKEHQDIL
jgi:hypothetical protein